MLIRSRKAHDVRPSEITDEAVYARRREFLKVAGLTALAGVGVVACDAGGDARAADAPVPKDTGGVPGSADDLGPLKASRFSTDQTPNAWEDVTTYNNFYEFGTGKGDPHRNAHTLQTDPWSVSVRGACEKPGTYALEDILKPHPLEERIYRLRCVEAWSMVVPWVGIPMGDVLERFQPTSKAKYVKFETLYDPEQMPGQRRRVLEWPYVEGLRMDEAMNPLTIFGVGVYGKAMPNQNGAPLRLIVPWKYGFKSIKSIVSIEFTERQPRNSWNVSQPSEYGFYANVNPEVDHPRWSQASERIIGSGLFSERKPTLMFNGYGEQVASLYAGMDLRRNY